MRFISYRLETTTVCILVIFKNIFRKLSRDSSNNKIVATTQNEGSYYP